MIQASGGRHHPTGLETKETNMSSDYTRLVPGTKVYYTGDVLNQCATGAITQRVSDKWGVLFEITWDADAECAKKPCWISACEFSAWPGTRLWLRIGSKTGRRRLRNQAARCRGGWHSPPLTTITTEGNEIMTAYTVEVFVGGEWTLHSEHSSYRDARNQSDTVHGRVLCPGGLTDRKAHAWARSIQGCDLDWSEWCGQDDDERAEYESGAGHEAEPATATITYSVAFVDGADGEWDCVHEFEAASIGAANDAAAAWVAVHYPGRIDDWYLVGVDGENANG